MKQKRQDVEYAKICLEEWAKWTLDTNGFPAESPTAKLGRVEKTSKIGSLLPAGIEPPSKDVDRAIFVFKMMVGSSSKGANRVHILRSVSLGRVGDETIDEAMRRLEFCGRKAYERALEDFASRLEMVKF